MTVRMASARPLLLRLTAAALLSAAAAVGVVHTTPDTEARAWQSSADEAERRGQQALASLSYPWRELGYTIEFREYTGGQLGSANSRTKKIMIYVKRSQSKQSLRITIAHEIGHALDFEHGTVPRHDDYRVIRRISRSGAWYPCDGCNDYRSHAGDWSEVFAYWLAGPGDYRSQVAGPPSQEQLRRLAPLFKVPPKPPSPSPSATRSAAPSPSPTAAQAPRPNDVVAPVFAVWPTASADVRPPLGLCGATGPVTRQALPVPSRTWLDEPLPAAALVNESGCGSAPPARR